MQKENNFEFVRLTAATLVILGHSFDLTKKGPGFEWFDTSVSSAAVRIFFVVSGYLICHSWMREPNVFRYFIKRFFRIFPGLIVVVLACAFIIGPIFSSLPLKSYLSHPLLGQYFWNVALGPHFDLPGVFDARTPSSAVNGSLWTLPMEVLMYAAVPFYASGSHNSRKTLTALFLITTLAAGIYYEAVSGPQIEPVVFFTSIPYTIKLAPYFVVAAAFAVWDLDKFLNLQISIILLALLPCIKGNEILYHAALFLFIPYIVLTFCLTKSPMFARFGAYIDLSYGVYLIAFPVQQVIIYLTNNKITPLELFVISTIISYLLAYLLARYIEEPARRARAYFKCRRDEKLDRTSEQVLTQGDLTAPV